MRTRSADPAATRRTPPGRFVLGALCCGLLVASGCANDPAPGEEAPAAASGAEQADGAGETPEPAMGAGGAEVAETFSPDAHADESRSVAAKIRDASLAAKVQLALADARDLRAQRFDPAATAGRVTLYGHVDTWAQRERAAAVAARVPGVVSVSNELTSTERRPAPLAEASGRSGGAAGDVPGGGNGSFGEGASPGGGAEGPLHHTVMQGESLWVISRKYGVSIDRIRSMNGLTSDTVRSGQRLRIR